MNASEKRFWTIPNALSLVRIAMVPLFVWCFFLDVLDSVAYCSDLITCIIIWNLDIELLLEIHDKLYDVK